MLLHGVCREKLRQSGGRGAVAPGVDIDIASQDDWPAVTSDGVLQLLLQLVQVRGYVLCYKLTNL